MRPPGTPPPPLQCRPYQHERMPAMAECDHEWVQWSGANRCRKCGATQQ
ncbi:hypothetical protein GTY92_03640 [Streptomyces sp. SID4950]|nr:hypothetical protein [Streptomyces sp. SID4950]